MKANIFNTVEKKRVDRNTMDLRHWHITSFTLGELTPTLTEEAMPGDNWFIQCQQFIRMPALKAPIFSPMWATTRLFSCPYRLLWPNWDNHMTGKSTHVVPTLTALANDITTDSLANYMDVSTEIDNDTIKLLAFDVAAYNKVFDDYYRSDSLGVEIFTELSDGDNSAVYSAYFSGSPQKVAYAHDYFNAALPSAQQGAEVAIPILEQDTIPVTVAGSAPYPSPLVFNATSGNQANWNVDATGGSPVGTLNNSGTPMGISPNGLWEVDVMNEVSNIATLRNAFRLKEFLEASIRGGGKRMSDWLRAIFDVQSPDATLDRPEYIGKVQIPIKFSEVVSTADSVGVPVGDLAGHAVGFGGSQTMTHYCSEYGIILGLTDVKPEAMYHQGIHRRYFRDDRLDWPIPHFAHIGEQPVYKGEIYIKGQTQTTAQETWGYNPRFAEMKHRNNKISGDFRTTEDYWHTARKFAAEPTLSETMISVQNSEIDRIFAVTGEQQVKANIYWNIKVSRKLPYFAIPSI